MRSRVRYWIVALALFLNLLSYLDRVCISIAAPSIRRELSLSPAQMGMVFSIFSLAYFLFLMPWGMAADRFGARTVVTLAIVWWSGFTALTAAAWNYISLLVIRFLFGSVEAAIMPSVASAFQRWIPVTERSTAFGAFMAGGRVGAAITPVVTAFLLLRFGWRLTFVVFAGLGIVAGAGWWLFYRNSPQAHPRVSPEELELISRGQKKLCDQERPRWAVLLARPQLICLLLVAFGYTFMWQFYVTWFPTYLIEKCGFTLAEATAYAGLPFLFGLCANWMGGILTDLLSRKFGVPFGRGSLGFAALLISALLLYVSIGYPNRVIGATLIALAAGVGDLRSGAAWASAVDIGGKAAGAVSGLMNAASNLGGFVSPLLMGLALQAWKDWNLVLTIAVLANTISAFFWLGVNPPLDSKFKFIERIYGPRQA